MDVNSAVDKDAGIADEQLENLVVFETSPHLDRREKAVLCYAERMTLTPADVSDAVFAEIQPLFSTEQITGTPLPPFPGRTPSP